ncbi:MAG: serine/threonine-protein phosphatase [Deltaproteobacteria bacterium]|nr:serine/threonine-protein phosphatase [Deltaproteobacteria bacterium]
MTTENRVYVNVKTEHIIASGLSDRGLVREENEDSIFLDESGQVLLLADGMGGHERGAEASQTAVKVFKEHLTPEKIKEELRDITAAAGVSPEIACLYTIIFRAVGKTAEYLAKRNDELMLKRYMGTTIVGLFLAKDGNVLWFHIGDSRLYLWRDSALKRLTADHSLYSEWVKAGRIGPEPNKNIITRVMGIDRFVDADIDWDKRVTNDLFLLCSDGLTDMITDAQIEEVLNSEVDVDIIANRLLDKALEAGGKDNTSVIVCRVV